MENFNFQRGRSPKAALDIGARKIAKKVDKIYVNCFLLYPPEDRTDSKYGGDHLLLRSESKTEIKGEREIIENLLKGDEKTYLDCFGLRRQEYSMKETLLFIISFDLAEEERGPDYKEPIYYRDLLGEIILHKDEIYEIPKSRPIPNSDFQCHMKGTYELKFMEMGVTISPGSGTFGTFITPGI